MLSLDFQHHQAISDRENAGNKEDRISNEESSAALKLLRFAKNWI